MFMLNLAVINKEVSSSKLQAQASDSCKEKKIVSPILCYDLLGEKRCHMCH